MISGAVILNAALMCSAAQLLAPHCLQGAHRLELRHAPGPCLHHHRRPSRRQASPYDCQCHVRPWPHFAWQNSPDSICHICCRLGFGDKPRWEAYKGLSCLIIGYNMVGYSVLRFSKQKFLPLSATTARMRS